MTARKMICRMSPSTNGSTMLVGTMWVRNCHHCWSSPFSMRELTASEVSMVLASALTPLPSGIRLIAISPVAMASRVPNWK